jgi:hypothetical protein
MNPLVQSATSSALSAVPQILRDPLLHTYNEIMKNFREGRWEPSELNVGKLCEVAFTILRGHVDGKFASKPQKPRNMVDACNDFEKPDKNIFSRSIRIQIPRMIIALYEVRNNRGVGHIGGDVDPNHMDALVVVHLSKWILCELVRLFHNVDTQTATQIVEALTERTLPLVWEVQGIKRVLRSDLPKSEQVLLLLYSHNGPVMDRLLFDWVEYSNFAVFREKALNYYHRKRLLEYESSTGLVHLSPMGVEHVEQSILTSK